MWGAPWEFDEHVYVSIEPLPLRILIREDDIAIERGEAGDSVQEALPGVLLGAQNFKGTTGHFLGCFRSWYLSTLSCRETSRTRMLRALSLWALDLGLVPPWALGLEVSVTGRATSYPCSPNHPCSLHSANMAAVTLSMALRPCRVLAELIDKFLLLRSYSPSSDSNTICSSLDTLVFTYEFLSPTTAMQWLSDLLRYKEL